MTPVKNNIWKFTETELLISEESTFFLFERPYFSAIANQNTPPMYFIKAVYCASKNLRLNI